MFFTYSKKTVEQKPKNIRKLCKEKGINEKTYHARIIRGWTHEQALNTPVRKKESVLDFKPVIDEVKETKTIRDLLKEYGIAEQTYYGRIRYGMTPQQALTTPVRQYRKKEKVINIEVKNKQSQNVEVKQKENVNIEPLEHKENVKLIPLKRVFDVLPDEAKYIVLGTNGMVYWTVIKPEANAVYVNGWHFQGKSYCIGNIKIEEFDGLPTEECIIEREPDLKKFRGCLCRFSFNDTDYDYLGILLDEVDGLFLGDNGMSQIYYKHCKPCKKSDFKFAEDVGL